MEGLPDQGYGAYRHPANWALELEPLSLSDMFERAAEAKPRAPLIDFFGRKFSYAEIAGLARRVATGLAAVGIRPGDRVGLYLPNVPHYVVAYYGALRLGAIVVNLSPLASLEEIRHQIGDSGARLIFTLETTRLLPQAVSLLGTSALERLVIGSVSSALSPSRAMLYRLFRRAEIAIAPSDARVMTFKALTANDGTVPKIGVDPEREVAVLQYSGGTTGQPKAAMLTHQALTANARQIDAADPYSPSRGEGEDDRVIGALPLFHIFAHSCVLNRTVVAGGEMVLLPRFEPAEVIAAIERTRATKMPGVPSMYQALLDHPGLRKADLSSLRLCISGGMALPQSLKERFEQRTGSLLVEGYGLTEGGMLCANPVDALNKPGTVGQPLPRTRIALVDREAPERDPEPGEAGEIIVQGPQIMQGYWRDAEAAPFVERKGIRWLRSGDVGMIDADGYVRIVDRLKDIISVEGVKVFPSQIEAILSRHPAVSEVLVIGVADHASGEIPQAFVTLIGGSATTAGELKAWLNPQLGRHEQVRSVELRESLPRTMVGKLNRRALIELEEVPPPSRRGAA